MDSICTPVRPEPTQRESICETVDNVQRNVMPTTQIPTTLFPCMRPATSHPMPLGAPVSPARIRPLSMSPTDRIATTSTEPDINSGNYGVLHSIRSGKSSLRNRISGGSFPISKRKERQFTRIVPAGGGGNLFSMEEVDTMLEILEAVLPLWCDEWESVTKIHQERFPDIGRTTEYLKRNFMASYRKRMPTGDPHIPPKVLKAKEIRRMLTNKSDILVGE